jgi:2-polyprenyl-6-hydroxyphenyl methylase/3-demethylubiquinone-9 3-methyltransferase
VSTREYHEAVWQALPAGLEPSDFALRRRFVLERVRAGDRVLDVGCGEGWFAAGLARAGAEVVGIDVADVPLARARQRHPQLDLRRVAPEGPWQLDDGAFDVVWAGEVIEHVADTAAWMSQARRVLRSGGRLLVSTPAHAPLTLMHMALSPGAFARRFEPRGAHLRFYSRATLTDLLADFRFESIDVRSVAGVPGARRLLLAHAIRSRF